MHRTDERLQLTGETFRGNASILGNWQINCMLEDVKYCNYLTNQITMDNDTKINSCGGCIQCQGFFPV